MSNAIKAFDFYLLRLPLLAISELRQLHASCPSYEKVAAALQALYMSQETQEAIYLVSPELYQELLKWLAQPNSARTEDKKLVLTLYKYWLRMSSRCTPYGLFAGFNTGAILETSSKLELASHNKPHFKHVRLDMNYVTELYQQVIKDPLVRTKLTYFVNNSLYKTQDTYRYYEYQVRDKRRDYFLVSIKTSFYLNLVIEASQAGASYNQLLEQLKQAAIPEARAQRFLNQLIDSQILLSEIEPTLTGREYFDYLIEKIAAIAPEYQGLAKLQSIKDILTREPVCLGNYQAAEEIIRHFFLTASSKELVQTDLRLSMANNVLNAQTVKSLTQDLSELAGLFKEVIPSDLSTFIKDFWERYEEQEIPLLEALDSEAGIGYGNSNGSKVSHTPLIRDVRVPKSTKVHKVAWTNYRQFIFNKFRQSQEQGSTTIFISEDELGSLTKGKAPQIPATFFAIGSLIAADSKCLDFGDFKFHMISCNGPGAMSLLARFAHADPLLAEKLAACAQWEQTANGEELIAEVVHLPNARIGNILQRTQLRNYEIPFLGNASVPPDQQFPVADLLVSVKKGRIVLRSQRLGKVIIPRLTTAHNYSQGLPIYQFLCDIQHQQAPFTIRWDWDMLLEEPYLPRVEYKHVILSRARWQVPASALAEAEAATTLTLLKAFLQAYRLPMQVLLADHDNELLLDFTCPLAREIFIQQLRKGPVSLVEFVHQSATSLVSSDDDRQYVNEVIIPFVHQGVQPVELSPLNLPYPVRRVVQRSFALGSGWLYLKVYSGTKWADKILAEYLWPCLQQLQAAGHVKEWFFIRFADPKNHIRLRLKHAPEPTPLAAIISALHQALHDLQQSRVVQGIQYDTYHREIERYGAENIEFSETIFCHDSVAVVRFLSLLEGEEGERYRWLFAIRGVDQLLTSFEMSLPDKLLLVQQTYEAFFQEFNGDASLKRQLNDKYREVSRALTTFLDPVYDAIEVQEAANVFADRAQALQSAYREFQAIWVLTNTPAQTIAEAARKLLPSYMHMFLNRIFLVNQRMHELVIYHYLTKYYGALIAQSKQKAAFEA
jgi:lantibiotic biosynthesis protein